MNAPSTPTAMVPRQPRLSAPTARRASPPASRPTIAQATRLMRPILSGFGAYGPVPWVTWRSGSDRTRAGRSWWRSPRRPQVELLHRESNRGARRRRPAPAVAPRAGGGSVPRGRRRARRSRRRRRPRRRGRSDRRRWSATSRRRGHRAVAAAVVGEPHEVPGPARILASHALLHAAEGELFWSALAERRGRRGPRGARRAREVDHHR